MSATYDDDATVVEIQEREIRRHKRNLTITTTVLAAIIVAIGVVFFLLLSGKNSELNEAREETEQLRLDVQMMASQQEFAEIDARFSSLENQTELLRNDSIAEKYNAARQQVEKLIQELNNEKTKSAAQIKQLQEEIATLKGILRDYTERINELMAENEDLRQENTTVKNENQQLRQNVASVSRDNERLNERMTLAEKLNVTGVNLVALNKKGKSEKNITKAKQLMVTFTIPQNNSTPAGTKTIYLQIYSPEGDLLGNGGTFSFEGATLRFTARTTVDYANEEIGGVTIYWDVNSTLNPGEYTVELFADNYRLASRKFTMTK